MTAEQQKKPVWRVKPKARARARALRREMTAAETKLWHALRAHRFFGASFRRQAPIGPCIADFVSHRNRLIIEVDGGQHFEGARARYDRQRDFYLQEKGFRVLRFSNLDVLKNRDGVLELIAAAIEDGPLPNPPPQAGDGGGSSHPKGLTPSLTLPLKGGGDNAAYPCEADISSSAPLPNPSPQGRRGQASTRGEAKK